MSDVALNRRRIPRASIADTELSVLAFPTFVALSRQDQRVIERFADQ